MAAMEAGRQWDKEVGHMMYMDAREAIREAQNYMVGWEAAREPRGKEGRHNRDVASRTG